MFKRRNQPALCLAFEAQIPLSTPTPKSKEFIYTDWPDIPEARPTRFKDTILCDIGTAMLKEGEILPDGYHVSRLNKIVNAGEGVQSSLEAYRIWRETQPILYQDVVIKRAAGHDVEKTQIITRQANQSGQPGFLPVYATHIADDPDDFSTCLMPFIASGSLKRYLPIVRHCLQHSNPLYREGATWFLLNCIAQTANAIAFLHGAKFEYGKSAPASVVHCDIKANNILIDIRRDDFTCYLIDFGTVRKVTELLQVSDSVGSQSNFSPARWASFMKASLPKMGLDVACFDVNPTSYDIWALGLVLAEGLGIDCTQLFPYQEEFDTTFNAMEYMQGRRRIVVQKPGSDFKAILEPMDEHALPSVDISAARGSYPEILLELFKGMLLPPRGQQTLPAEQMETQFEMNAAQVVKICQEILAENPIQEAVKAQFLTYLHRKINKPTKENMPHLTASKKLPYRQSTLTPF